MKDRITIRLNEVEKAELNLLMKEFNIDNPSEALKIGVKWVNNYLKNVTALLFPPDYEIILKRKLKTDPTKRKIY